MSGTLFLFCGLPCSGKTTLAKTIQSDLNAVRFTLDEWMIGCTDLSIHDDEYGEVAERLKKQFREVSKPILAGGTDVIFDWSLWNPERRQRWVTFSMELQVPYKLYYLQADLQLIESRLQERNIKDTGEGSHLLTIDEIQRFANQLFVPPSDQESIDYQLWIAEHNQVLDGKNWR